MSAFEAPRRDFSLKRRGYLAPAFLATAVLIVELTNLLIKYYLYIMPLNLGARAFVVIDPRVALKQPSRYRGASSARDFSSFPNRLSVLASVCAHEGNTTNAMYTNAR